MDFLYKLQGLRNPVLEKIFAFFTNFGEELLVIGVLCIIFWCINKKLAYKICFTYFISGLMVQGLKVVLRIERPWVRDPRLTVSDTAVDTATGYSFPSGHTQGCTGLFSSLAFHYKKTAGFIICFTIIALLMFSRMFLGCHTPLDVLVSFGITFITSIIVNYIFENFSSTNATDIIVFLLIELISGALIGYSCYIIFSGKAPEELAMDSIKAAGAGIGFGIGWFIEKKFIDYDPKSTSTIWGQLLKLVIGIAIAFAFKQVPKVIFGSGIVVNVIRYALAVIWIVAIYPAIIKKITR